MPDYGVTEWVVVLIMAGFWLLPLMAAVWVLITLRRIRIGLDEVRVQLSNIERDN